MKNQVTRRNFLATAGTAALAAATTAALAAAPAGDKPLRILGVACSPRKGMTTAKAVQVALDAAKAVDFRIQVELIDLVGLNLVGWSPTPPKDDFNAILPKLKDSQFGGLIIASPSYFRSLSSLCKAFIERCMPLREGAMLLADKPVGALAVGGNRNGGQELVVQQILTAMLGVTLWSAKDEVNQDETGLQSAKLLGVHVAEVALRHSTTP